jgi:large subunit ribosomal protein L22
MTEDTTTDEGTEVEAAATPEEQAKATRSERREAGESRPVRAVAKYLRFSAQKGRLVVDQVRGKTVLDAATALAFSDRDASREVMKVLKSAVSNAENNHGMRADELYVSAAFVDEGPTFKRFKPRARGRADRINKRTCHVTIIVDNAPTELLEGRGASAAGSSKSRAARVAGSKAAAGAEKKPTTKKAPAKKAAATKAPAKKAAAEKKPADEPKPAEQAATTESTDDAADAAITEGEA